MRISRTLVGLPFDDFKEIFGITVVPGRGQEVKYLNITNGTISEITEKSLTFYLIFESPIHISSKDSPDILIVEVLQPELFLDQNNSQTIDSSNTLFRMVLPPQVSRDLDKFKSATNSMKSGMQLFMIFQVIVASSCEPFWAMINTL